MKLHFFIRRLATMSPGEVWYRIRQVISHNRDSLFSNGPRLTGSFTTPDRLSDFMPDPEKIPALLRKADEIRSGRMPLFALEDLLLQDDIDYHRDYKSGKSAPRDRRGSRIDYRDSEAIGDIKYIWEPNRLLFLPLLALAYRSSGDQAYLHSLQNYLALWLRQNPYPNGVNWNSPLEMAIRLINWTLVWNLVGSQMMPALVRQWEASALRQAWYIHRYFSLYSSANNHLIGEAAGLYIAATALFQGPETDRWRKKSWEILCREIQRQNTADGVNREQSLSYQQFVLDFFILAAAFARRAGENVPTEYAVQLEKMLAYLAQCLTSQGEPFTYGDDDDGLVVDLLQKSSPGIYRSLLQTGSFLFHRPSLDRQSSGQIQPDLKTSLIRFLSGPEPLFRSSGEKIPDSYPQGGRYFLGRNFGQADEEKLLFDCGSLGYLSIAAHGHADALSFIYGACGRLFFVDPGTYAYHGDRKWRDYFRGTSAHNTAVIDGKNQSQILGSFMWGRKAHCRLLQHQALHLISGSHDGYRPVLHRRTVLFSPQGEWRVTDEFSGSGNHQADIFFHLHPEIRVTVQSPHDFLLARDTIQLQLHLDSALTCRLISGQEEPPLGWYSPSYDQKTPSPVICGTTAFADEITSTCTFKLVRRGE